jgi:hypothetical protein
MPLPNPGTHPRAIENLRIGGGYNSLPDGGIDADAVGNLALDGDLTVDGAALLSGFLSLGTPSTVEISSGAITISRTHHLIDTEGLAAVDDLDTINGGQVGSLLVLRAVSTSRKTTFKDSIGNIRCGGDFTLANSSCLIVLLLEDNGWKCIAKSTN